MGFFDRDVRNGFDRMFDFNRDGKLDMSEQAMQFDYNIKFQSSNITNCNYKNALFKGIDFCNCNLKNSTFIGASFENVIFMNCNLKGADFTGAKFHNV